MRTVNFHRMTGSPCSAAQPGSVWKMANGTYISSPRNNQTSTGRTRRYTRNSRKRYASGPTMALMASVSMWRTAWPRILNACHLKRWANAIRFTNRYAMTALTRFGIVLKCTTSTASGAKCSTSTIRHASPSVRPGAYRSISICTPPPKSWDRCSISSSPKPTGTPPRCVPPSRRAWIQPHIPAAPPPRGS